ncbi:ABC transporter ATP-binding protein [Hydrogenophaga flava]|uniref:ABC transporter ATP-binding protein n=1 Tax=Hydrogenophaga flava TaxID=65657 RepID=UPI000A541F49|nr:ABC transporter ATP-binding protein [Hydrogenophaga flava]
MSLVARGLSVRYGARPALHSIDLDLLPGQLVALLGPNGSGKSTLLRSIAGLLPHEGVVTLAGEPRHSQRIGYMPQDTSATAALTVMETVLLGRVERLRWRVSDEEIAAVASVLRRLGIEALASRGLRELSGGQRQLVFLAQALVAEPSVLLLDEPISALDLRHQLEVMETVSALTRERGLVTLVVLHDLNAATRHADRLLLMREGRLHMQDSAESGLSLRDVEAVFDIEAELLSGQRVGQVIAPWRSRPRLISS